MPYSSSSSSLQLKHCWPSTSQVIGCLKGVLATILSVLIFQNAVSAVGAMGYAITVTGVFVYGWSKVGSLR